MPGMNLSRSLFIIVLIVITIAVAILLNTGTPLPETGDVTGTLTGTVTIGPLCPVEPCTISHDQIVAAYAARPITITTEGGAFVGSVTADPDNGYSISLRPGPTWWISGTRESAEVICQGRSPSMPGKQSGWISLLTRGYGDSSISPP